MQENYSFLADELALMEIRKHKWIESQKLGREIGFASAAYEWITKYGQAWKNNRLPRNTNDDIFIEKRRYQRFTMQFPVLIKAEAQMFLTQTKEISLVGFSCPIPLCLETSCLAEITINFLHPDISQKQSTFKYLARLLGREPAGENESRHFQTVFPLSEQLRDFLRQHQELFAGVPRL